MPFLSDLTDTLVPSGEKGDPREAATSGGLDQEGATSVVNRTVPPCGAAEQVAALLNTPEISTLIADLDATRWTGRPGYPLRATVGMALTKSVYALPTWTRTVALVREHAALRAALGVGTDAPSVHACYRFAGKLHEHKGMLDTCLDRVTAALRERMPEMGRTLAIDGLDLPAYANGQRYVSKGGPERERFSDPDASWGHRDLHPQGWRLLRLQASRRRLRRHRPAGGLAGGDREDQRDHHRHAAARQGAGARIRRRVVRVRQGLRQHHDLRRVRGTRHPPNHPAAADPRRQSGPAPAALV